MRLLRVLAVAGIALESAKDALRHRRFHYVVLITFEHVPPTVIANLYQLLPGFARFATKMSPEMSPKRMDLML